MYLVIFLKVNEILSENDPKCISQGPPETKLMGYRQIDMYYEGLALLIVKLRSSTICLQVREAQDSRWCCSSPHPRSKNQESQWSRSRSESKDIRTRSTDLLGQDRLDAPTQGERERILLLPFYPFQAFHELSCPSASVRAISFPQSTNSFFFFF